MKEIKQGQFNFKLVDDNKVVIIDVIDKNLTNLVVPAKVEIEGREYIVDGINSDAFNGCDKLPFVNVIWEESEE
jgi:hypothetical protein